MPRKPTQDEVLRSLDKKLDKVLSILDNVHNRGIKVMLNVAKKERRQGVVPIMNKGKSGGA